MATAPTTGADASAEVPYEPAFYLEWMEKSPLKYSVVEGTPKQPLESFTCAPRSTDLRAVQRGSKVEMVEWKLPALAAKQFEKAEKYYRKEKWEKAEEAYAEALKLAPDWGPGWIHAGDAPFGRGDYEKALTFYRRALDLDDTLATAHWFAGDALRKLGRFDEATEEFVTALALDPTNERAWKVFGFLAQEAGFTIRRVAFAPPKMVGVRSGDTVEIGITKENAEEWLGYAACRAVWAHEEEFRRAQGVPAHGLSSVEEDACVKAYLSTSLSRAAREIAAKGGVEANTVEVEHAATLLKPPASDLMELTKRGLLDGFVLFERMGTACPAAASTFAPEALAEAKRYVREFVIVRAPETSN